MSQPRSEEHKDLLAESCPTTFDGVDLDVVVPDQYSFPKRYWYMGPVEREVTWLLDQGRIDDAVVYYINEVGASFAGEMPFLQSRPDPDARIARLRAKGRLRLFKETMKPKDRWYGTDELVLGPKSGIDVILRDVEFLNEHPNPAYAFKKSENPLNP